MTLLDDFKATIQRTSLPEQPTMLAVDRQGQAHVVALVGNERQLARAFIRQQKIQEYVIARCMTIDGEQFLVFTSEKRSEVGRVKTTYLLPEYFVTGNELISGSLFT